MGVNKQWDNTKHTEHKLSGPMGRQNTREDQNNQNKHMWGPMGVLKQLGNQTDKHTIRTNGCDSEPLVLN